MEESIRMIYFVGCFLSGALARTWKEAVVGYLTLTLIYFCVI